MAARFLLWTHPEKPIPDGVITRDIDKEGLIKLMIAFGCEPMFTEGEQGGGGNVIIWVHFLPDQVDKFEPMYYSNTDPVLPASRFAYADDFWRNMMVSGKSKKRYLDRLAQRNDK